MEVVYALEPFPTRVSKSIFLAGPTPRDANTESWRPEAIQLLQQLGYDGHVFVPEPRGQKWHENYLLQVEWEEEGLSRADVIVFWVPRNMQNMPALTTNIEFGMHWDSGKLVIGAPQDAPHMNYLMHYALKQNRGWSRTLLDTLKTAIDLLDAGDIREGDAAHIPLHLWRSQSFMRWYRSHRMTEHPLVEFRLKSGIPEACPEFWIAHVKVRDNHGTVRSFVCAGMGPAGSLESPL